MKIYVTISHSYLCVTVTLCYIMTTFEQVMWLQEKKTHIL